MVRIIFNVGLVSIVLFIFVFVHHDGSTASNNNNNAIHNSHITINNNNLITEIYYLYISPPALHRLSSHRSINIDKFFSTLFQHTRYS